MAQISVVDWALTAGLPRHASKVWEHPGSKVRVDALDQYLLVFGLQRSMILDGPLPRRLSVVLPDKWLSVKRNGTVVKRRFAVAHSALTDAVKYRILKRGFRLRDVRKYSGLKQEEVAAGTGISSVSKLEGGKCSCSMEMMDLFALYFTEASGIEISGEHLWYGPLPVDLLNKIQQQVETKPAKKAAKKAVTKKASKKAAKPLPAPVQASLSMEAPPAVETAAMLFNPPSIDPGIQDLSAEERGALAKDAAASMKTAYGSSLPASGFEQVAHWLFNVYRERLGF